MRAALAVGVAVSLCACGHAATPVASPVKLTLRAPADGSRLAAATTTVSGAVSPLRARVLVVGHTVKLNAAGAFSTTVSLVPGTNLIDVIASAPHARPAMTALRIIRFVLVTVPDVTGESPTKAAATISGTGLKPRVQGDGDPLSFLLPLPEQVCAQSPGGGARVQPDRTVTVQLGKVCT